MSTGNKERRYLFDAHNFDQPDEPEIDENAPPPPPVFSLEDLDLAKQESFSQGRLTGLEEAAASRAQYIATQIEKLAHDLQGVLLAEQKREKIYEQEVLSLCEAIFARAFPALNQIYGMTEVLQVIRKVLTTQPDHAKLVIEVPTDERSEILAHLEKLPEFDPARVELQENANLSRGSCKMSWQNGGALRDHVAIAAEILKQLEQALAPAVQKDQDMKVETKGD